MSDWIGNKNSIYKTIGASNHTDKEREENDYYATDPIAIDKLIAVDSPHFAVWECACGEGHLSERLKDYGCTVFSSDIIDRGYREQNAVVDFLAVTETCPFDGYCDIVTNPPYKYAKEFVKKSLELIKHGRKVYMLLKLTFCEGKARYKEIFSTTPPKKIYVFSERLLCAKNAKFEEMQQSGGSAVCYAWFVWEKGYKGKTILEWI